MTDREPYPAEIFDDAVAALAAANDEVERLREEGDNLASERDARRADLEAALAEAERLLGERVRLLSQVHDREAEVERLRAWGQQVHDALDGKPLPELPDEAPARIERLRAALERCLEKATKHDDGDVEAIARNALAEEKTP